MNISEKRFKELEKFLIDCRDPFFFINEMWGLEPQPPKPEFAERIKYTSPTEWKAEWFGTSEEIEFEGNTIYNWIWHDFEKGKHVTWQQTAVLTAIRDITIEQFNPERSLLDFINKVSVASGNGIGKTAMLSWLIFWFLFCFKGAQVPCTSASASQLKDALWKELAVWRELMPDIYKPIFSVDSTYVRVQTSPNSWFARARTARPEKPEAFSGIHSDHVCPIFEEASGVHDTIYEFGKGVMTSEHVLALLISNPTRANGEFFKSQHDKKHLYICFQFSSEESPVVSFDYLKERVAKGRDTYEFRVFVKGLFPDEDAVDEKGYSQLIKRDKLIESIVPSAPLVGDIVIGVDPSEGGSDSTAIVIRTNLTAKVALLEAVSEAKPLALKIIEIALEAGLKKTDAHKIVVDAFGVGFKVVKELALLGWDVTAVNVGDKFKSIEGYNQNQREDLDKHYENIRAKIFWEIRAWLKQGGQLVGTIDDWEEFLDVRYKRNLRNRIQIMSKDLMRKDGLMSPNKADALSLTFLFGEKIEKPKQIENMSSMIHLLAKQQSSEFF